MPDYEKFHQLHFQSKPLYTKRQVLAVFLYKERKSNDRKTGGAAIVLFITIQTFLGDDLKQGSNNRYPVFFYQENHSAWIKTLGRN